MKDNMNNLNISQDLIEVGKQIGINPEDFMVLLLILKNKVKINNYINNMIKEMVSNKNEEDINKELNELIDENYNNDKGGGQLFDFPDANKEIPEEKEEENFQQIINNN